MWLKTYAHDQDRLWVQAFPGQLAHFCDVIRGAAVPLVTVHDGLQNLRLTEAIAKAARSAGPT
ncbi:oxidoreductase domain-containing protein [Cupriavidus basilensis OR16]|uniref:Oxidoreductase domain-containing protein n=1 Tax=Cupriavidus basilensis OR16 TaxID=1127483 RepID=H1S524_9BURK|nr:oxidoreductase domain-containing protein [Cupriavidus basilensis OR16]